jgi:hypothetical protein
VNDLIDKDPLYYKEYSLNPYLASYHNASHIQSNSLNQRIRKLIKLFLWPLSIFGNFLIGSTKYKENNLFNNSFRPKYLFVVCYSKEHRAFPILNNIIKVSNPDEVLVYTDNRDVYKYYLSKKINCIYLKILGLAFDQSLSQASNLSSEELFILSKVKLYFDHIEIIMKKFRPKFTLTICDLQTIERVITEVAEKFNSVTITHQHGQMKKTNPLLKYTISNYIVVWGEQTRKNFIDLFEKTKIIVLGTDIYQELFEKAIEANEDEKTFITLALNPRSNEINFFIIEKVCKQMNNLSAKERMKYSLVLKLHPEMNIRYWSSKFISYIKASSLKMEYKIYTDQNEYVLKKSKILIVLSSSITLQAFICNVSVICVESIPDLYKNPAVFFNRIPESVVKIGNLSNEIQNRLQNSHYNRTIISKQKLSLKEEIAFFDASLREKEWINTLDKTLA